MVSNKEPIIYLAIDGNEGRLIIDGPLSLLEMFLGTIGRPEKLPLRDKARPKSLGQQKAVRPCAS